MLKKLLLLTSFLSLCVSVYSQGTEKLIGRWHNNSGKPITSDILFLGNNTGAFVSASGLLFASFTYTVEKNNDQYRVTYTTDINSKKKRHGTAAIKFIGDSIMLFKFASKLPASADTNTARLMIYKKVNMKVPDHDLHFPTHSDLIGDWVNYFKNKEGNEHIIFKADNTVVFTHADGSSHQGKYKVDFSKQPFALNFIDEKHKSAPTYVGFMHEKSIILRVYKRGSSEDPQKGLSRNTIFEKK